MKKSYDDWWCLIRTLEFDNALGSLAWYSERIMRDLFYKREQKERNSLTLIRRTDNEIFRIEQESRKALLRYEQEFSEPFSIYTWLDPYEILGFYDEDTELYQDIDITKNIVLFLTVEALVEYVVSYESLELVEQFSGFKDISALILVVYSNIVATSERNDEKLIFRDNARKAGLAKQSPYEKGGTIKAVNELLAEKKDLLNQRGGKATLNKMILDLIATGDIPAPNTPSTKTVDLWIDKFRNTQSTS